MTRGPYWGSLYYPAPSLGRAGLPSLHAACILREYDHHSQYLGRRLRPRYRRHPRRRRHCCRRRPHRRHRHHRCRRRGCNRRSRCRRRRRHHRHRCCHWLHSLDPPAVPTQPLESVKALNRESGDTEIGLPETKSFRDRLTKEEKKRSRGGENSLLQLC